MFNDIFCLLYRHFKIWDKTPTLNMKSTVLTSFYCNIRIFIPLKNNRTVLTPGQNRFRNNKLGVTPDRHVPVWSHSVKILLR